MTRVNVVLSLAILATAFHLVNLKYESRRLYASIELARSRSERLQADHEQLLAAKRMQAAPGRVQPIAQQQLKMFAVHPGITEYIALTADAQSADTDREEVSP